VYFKSRTLTTRGDFILTAPGAPREASFEEHDAQLR